MTKSKEEKRLSDGKIYYEKHHIVPVFMFKTNKRYKTSIGEFLGNPDDPDNLVLLTPREHFLSHLLLCKIYKNTKYYQGCLTSLFLMSNKFKFGRKNEISFNRNQIITKLFSTRLYNNARLAGRKAISEARLGKIVVKDKNTGKIIGSIDKQHPKIISGEWVHHSKGIKFSNERKAQLSQNSKGENNPRHSGISNDMILLEFLLLCDKLKEIPLISFFRKVWNIKHETKFPDHLSKYRFNNGKELALIAHNKLGYALPNKRAKHFFKLDPKKFI